MEERASAYVMGNRPPMWSVVGTLISAPLFMGAVIAYVPYALSGWRFAPPLLGVEFTRWIAVGLIAIAALVLLEFLVRFVAEGHGTPLPVAPPTRLVVGGAFRFVRNPGYIGAVSAIAGQGLLFGSAPVLIYAAVMALAFHLFVIGYEEPTLRRTFGTDYEAYFRRVRRWVPRRPNGMR